MSAVQVKLYTEIEQLKNLGALVTGEKDTLSKNLIVIDGYAYINNADMTGMYKTAIPFDIIVDYGRFCTTIDCMGDQELILTYHEDSGTLSITDLLRNNKQVLNVTKPAATTVFFDYKDFRSEKLEEIETVVDNDDALAEFLAYLKDTKGLGTLPDKSTHALAKDAKGRMEGDTENLPFNRGFHVHEADDQYYIISNNVNHIWGIGHPNKNAVLSNLVGTGLSGRVSAAILKITAPLSCIRFNDTVCVFEYMDGTTVVATKLRQIDNDHDFLALPVKVRNGKRKVDEQEEYATPETATTVNDLMLRAIKLVMLGFTDGNDPKAKMRIDSTGIAHLSSDNGSAVNTFDTKLRGIEPRKMQIPLHWLMSIIGEGDSVHFGIGACTVFKQKGCCIMLVEPVED